MWSRELHPNVRGGVVLDLVLAAGLILVAAFALELLGVSLFTILSGAGRFFGF